MDGRHANRTIHKVIPFMRSISIFSLFFLLAGTVSLPCYAHQIEKESERITFEISLTGKPESTGLIWPFTKKKFEIEVRVTNGTDKDIYFERPVRFSNLHFVVIDESGKDVQMSPDVVEPSVTEAYFVRIQPQGSYAEKYDLLDLGRSEFRYRFERGVLYNVYATYSSGYEMERFKRVVKDKDAILFKGQLESNIRSFRW